MTVHGSDQHFYRILLLLPFLPRVSTGEVRHLIERHSGLSWTAPGIPNPSLRGKAKLDRGNPRTRKPVTTKQLTSPVIPACAGMTTG